MSAITASTSQAALAVKTPEGRCASALSFICVDLLNDCVCAVGAAVVLTSGGKHFTTAGTGHG